MKALVQIEKRISTDLPLSAGNTTLNSAYFFLLKTHGILLHCCSSKLMLLTSLPIICPPKIYRKSCHFVFFFSSLMVCFMISKYFKQEKLFQCNCSNYLQVMCNHQNNAISYDTLNFHFLQSLDEKNHYNFDICDINYFCNIEEIFNIFLSFQQLLKPLLFYCKQTELK